jgi:hypothetical protein
MSVEDFDRRMREVTGTDQVLSRWIADQHVDVANRPADERAADLVGLGGFALAHLSRVASSAEAAAQIAGLTRPQLEAIVLAAAFERRRQDVPESVYMAWGGVPAVNWVA